MLFSESRDLPGNAMMEQAARAEMTKSGTNRIEFFAESLDAGRFSEEGYYRLFREYLEKKYAGRHLDLMMAFMARDFGLVNDFPATVISNLPVVFVAVSEEPVPRELGGSRFAGIVHRFDVRGTLKLIFQLQPETRRMVVIGGVSRTDRLALNRIADATKWVAGVDFDFWTNRPMAMLQEGVTSLPPDTVILLSSMQQDAAGQHFFTSQLVRLLAPSARAPIYVLGAGSLGTGAVGGAVVDFQDLGGDAADLALRALAGKNESQPAIELRTNGTPMVDWRALRQWHIKADRLPADCVVRFRPTSLWAEHRGFILTGAGIFAVQALTIGGLLVQRRHRRRAEAAAQENQAARALLAAIVEHSEEAIIRTELAGNIVTWNRGAERLFGFTAREAVGQSVELIIPAGLRPEERSLTEQIRRGEPVRLHDTIRLRKNGSPVQVSLTLSPIRDEGGKVVGTSKICRDITSRKRAEAELERQRAELAHFARVSTVGQLTMALAHELNQPLGAILRNAEAAEILLRREPPDLEETRAILADIRKDDQRAGAVIDRLRGLLKPGSSQSLPVEVGALIQETVALVWHDAVSRQVKLTADLAPQLPPVRGDRVQLQQVLLNLVLNGMDAMSEVPAASRSLVLRAGIVEGNQVEVVVTDCGAGFPEAVLAHAFEPFVTTKPKGLGMGLAISKTIIEAHGGTIRLQNNAGAGAAVTITLPAEKAGCISNFALPPLALRFKLNP